MPRLMCAGVDDARLAVELGVEDVLARELLERLDERPADEVRERDLAAAGARRWLLITMRLSIISFAGMVRTLVAVGHREAASMFAARVLGMPAERDDLVFARRRRRRCGCGLVTGASAGTGVGCGAPTEVVRAAGAAPIDRDGAVAGAGAALVGGRGRLGLRAARLRRRSAAAGCSGAGASAAAGASARRAPRLRPPARRCRLVAARGSATTTCRPSPGRRGTSRTSRRRAIRWLRTRPTPSRRLPTPVNWLDTASRPLSPLMLDCLLRRSDRRARRAPDRLDQPNPRRDVLRGTRRTVALRPWSSTGRRPSHDLTYSDVFLVPSRSGVTSRLDVSLAPDDGTGGDRARSSRRT